MEKTTHSLSVQMSQFMEKLTPLMEELGVEVINLDRSLFFLYFIWLQIDSLQIISLITSFYFITFCLLLYFTISFSSNVIVLYILLFFPPVNIEIKQNVLYMLERA